VAAVQNSPRVIDRHAATPPELMKAVCVLLELVGAIDVDDRDLRSIDVVLRQERPGDFLPNQQDRLGQAFVDEDLSRPNDLLLIALRKDDSLRIALRTIVETMHDSARPS